MKKILALLVILWSPAALGEAPLAFSPGFIKDMTDSQAKSVLDGNPFTEKDLARCWDRFDEEVLQALSGPNGASAEKLNQQFVWEKIIKVEKNKTEEEPIELGAVEAKFYSLQTTPPVWLVTYYYGYGITPASTFRIFKKEAGSFKAVYSFENDKTLPDQSKLQWTALQIQTLTDGKGTTQFNSFHLPPQSGGKLNRLQVDWEWDGNRLKGLRRRNADWHQEKGQTLPGPGKYVRIR
ncbi:MAG: hypothetical protein HYS22_07365 [Deltaproteobacteria bacterium]|nr:hypothetical protein [Deltaproteobacteria bacterium]